MIKTRSSARTKGRTFARLHTAMDTCSFRIRASFSSFDLNFSESGLISKVLAWFCGELRSWVRPTARPRSPTADAPEFVLEPNDNGPDPNDKGPEKLERKMQITGVNSVQRVWTTNLCDRNSRTNHGFLESTTKELSYPAQIQAQIQETNLEEMGLEEMGLKRASSRASREG